MTPRTHHRNPHGGGKCSTFGQQLPAGWAVITSSGRADAMDASVQEKQPSKATFNMCSSATAPFNHAASKQRSVSVPAHACTTGKTHLWRSLLTKYMIPQQKQLNDSRIVRTTRPPLPVMHSARIGFCNLLGTCWLPTSGHVGA